MKDLYEYVMLTLTLSPLLFYIIAVSFRLLDNSALLFLQKEILVNTANVSIATIRQQIETHPDRTFARQLKRALIYRRLHRIFLMLMFASLPLSLLQFFIS